ncbi:MAG: hypothetical protein ACXWTR_06345, partial [Methylotenera sp.]
KQDATAMEYALQSSLTQKAECIHKKLTPPGSCKHLTGFYQAEKVYNNTVKQHPDWRDKSLHWNTPKDHHLELNSLNIVF